jgi:hypothetical protein
MPHASTTIVVTALFAVGLSCSAACDNKSAQLIDAVATLDTPNPDAVAPVFDAPQSAGFGLITGQCGSLDDVEWNASTPFWFEGHFDFANDRYDDPADRSRLTPGGLAIVTVPNAGGSSVFSEVFAYEWLARCEGATLLKTETEIVYDTVSKKADILVQIDGRKVGVSVTRAVMFPFGQPYTPAAATTLFQRKLDDIQLATASVSAADKWSRQMVVVLAYDMQHAQVAMDAWNALTPATKDDTILLVAITDGDDAFIYTDR